MQTQITSERISEAAGILAIGVLRAKRRQIAQMKKTSSLSETGLDFSQNSSVHCINPSARGEKP